MKIFYCPALMIVVLLFVANVGAQTSTSRQTITTYAGPSLPVSGALAITQVFDFTSAPVLDGAGGFYFAAWVQNRVYRVKADGTLLVIAGTGAVGFSGDGGLAIAAELSLPTGIALDGQGNLFIADLGNNRVRKVGPAGIISTVAGTGIGTIGSDGDGGPATSARLNPFGLAVDVAGNLFIADLDNCQVRKVNLAGIISTVAGTGTRGFGGDGGLAVSAQLFGPKSVALDSLGNLYIADTFNDRIRRVTDTGIISTVAGTGTKGFSGDSGPATSAQLNWPSEIVIDSAGNLLIADNSRIRKVTPEGIISTVAGGGIHGIDYVGGFAVDSTGSILSDDGTGRIRKVTTTGIITTVAGNGRSQGFAGDQGPASSARFLYPRGLTFDTDGNLYIADTLNDRIRMVSQNGTVTTVAGTATRDYSGEGGPATDDSLFEPRAVALDGVGNMFIADTLNNRIRKVSTGEIFSRTITTVAGTGISGFGGDGDEASSAQLAEPSGIVVDRTGNLYIADTKNNRIRRVSAAGIITTVAGLGTQGFSGDGGPAVSAQIASPSAVAVDSAGSLFIADSGNNRIRKVTPAGVISTIAGIGTAGFSGDGGMATNAQLSLAGSSETLSTGLVVDPIGNVYIADTGNHRIRKVSRDGTITTVAGASVRGFSGDGDQPTSAQFFNPSGIAVDRIGNVFISDTFNGRIRKVTFTSETTFSMTDRGGVSLGSSGTSAAMAAGYASIQPDTGSMTPAGLAILGFRQNNVLVSEAGISASPLVQSARIYAEVNGAINTGVAIANPNNQAADISFFFTGANGDFGNGTMTIPANGQIAKFLNEPPFNSPSPLIGTFTFRSSIPVSVVALRGLTNERSEFLITTLPVVDLKTVPFTSPIVLPHFAVSSGWTTHVILVNSTDTLLTGTIQFINPSGQAAAIATPASLVYAVPARSSQKIQTSGATPTIVTGSVRVIPGKSTTAPFGFAIFSFRNGGTTVTEAAVPAVPAGSAFRLYAEVSELIETGIGVANTSGSIARVTLELSRLDGSSTGLIGTLTVPANGQVAIFLKEVQGFGALHLPMQGVLRITSDSPVSVIGLRGHYNERRDFLITTTPTVDESTALSNSALFFPHFADSEGYTTQFILFSARPGSSASGKIHFFSQDGRPLNLIFK